jgi:hypothetical protein
LKLSELESSKTLDNNNELHNFKEGIFHCQIFHQIPTCKLQNFAFNSATNFHRMKSYKHIHDINSSSLKVKIFFFFFHSLTFRQRRNYFRVLFNKLGIKKKKNFSRQDGILFLCIFPVLIKNLFISICCEELFLSQLFQKQQLDEKKSEAL